MKKLVRYLRWLSRGICRHRWNGYDEQPLGWIHCRKCGYTP